jgi:hypothetical protein
MENTRQDYSSSAGLEGEAARGGFLEDGGRYFMINTTLQLYVVMTLGRYGLGDMESGFGFC